MPRSCDLESDARAQPRVCDLLTRVCVCVPCVCVCSAGAGCSSSGPQALPPSPAVAGRGAAGAIGAVGGSVHLYPHISQGVLPLNYPDARLSSVHMPPPPPRMQPLLQAAAAGGRSGGTSTTTTDALSAGLPLGGAPHESLLGGPPGGGRDGTPSSTIAEASEEGGADD